MRSWRVRGRRRRRGGHARVVGGGFCLYGPGVRAFQASSRGIARLHIPPVPEAVQALTRRLAEVRAEAGLPALKPDAIREREAVLLGELRAVHARLMARAFAGDAGPLP